MSTSNANRLRADERAAVEKPLLDQLESLGWTILDLPMNAAPEKSGRTDFDTVILRPRFEAALQKLNPWLQSDQLDELYSRLSTLPSADALENNRHFWEKLTGGEQVSENRETGEGSPSVSLLNFDEPTQNDFLAVAQFKLRIPGTQKHIIPDVTLFVNGFPLVVIECKSPKVMDGIAEAIDQINRYAQNRGETGEGVPALFAYNAFTVATTRTSAKFGTLSTLVEKYFFRWLDPFPRELKDLPHEGTTPNDQTRLVAGMMDKANLLSILRDYTVFSADDNGKPLKIVARYQQFRAVKKALLRLQDGSNKRERGGIIWHTQGAGKSLTMLFLVKEMRRRTRFADWKIVFLTDRTDLQDQLEKTAASIGQTPNVADSIADTKTLLAQPTADLAMVMSQKFQDSVTPGTFPLLNSSEKILILIDEAHRTQYSTLAMCMDAAMPNATRIAYTGTPIDKTEHTFGDYIDKYTMKESVDEGTTLRIVYEGRTTKAEVFDKEAADAKFLDVFGEYNLSERLQILGFGTREAYLEAQPVIEAKARDMVEHYITHVFPNGFKGQVVATSKEAAFRYKIALETAIAEQLSALETKNPSGVDIERLREMEVAVVISDVSHNDKPHLKEFGKSQYQKRAIRRFKMGFGEEETDETDGDKEGDNKGTLTGNVGLLVVVNMLLTGFDAPIEQVLYLDRTLQNHGLLQAIARVNRIGGQGKDQGFVVDYVGVGHHLQAALENYAEREQKEITDELHDDERKLGELKAANEKVWAILRAGGIENFGDVDAFSDLFYDEETRNKYILAFRELTAAFNAVMPAKEAMPFWNDFQNFLAVNQIAAQTLGDGRLSMKGIPPKLRALADEFLEVKGIATKVEPMNILGADFEAKMSGFKRSKTKVAAIEHAVRNYLEVNWDEDPDLFASFADELTKILEEFRGNWEAILAKLQALRETIKNREKEESFGLDRKRELPVYRLLKRELFPETAPQELEADTNARLVQLTQSVVETLRRETALVGFWSSTPAQNRLRREIQELLIGEDAFQFFGKAIFNARGTLTSRFMEWAKANPRVLAPEV